jgi:hypothetical protein
MKAEVEAFRRRVAELGWDAGKEREREGAMRAAKDGLRQSTEVSLMPHRFCAC